MKVDQFLRQRGLSTTMQDAVEDILLGLSMELNLGENLLGEDYEQPGGREYISYPYVFRDPILPKIAKYFNSIEREIPIYDSLVFEAKKNISMAKLKIMDLDEGGVVYLTFKQGRRLDPIYFEISAF